MSGSELKCKKNLLMLEKLISLSVFILCEHDQAE